MDQHGGRNAPRDAVGGEGAGCLIGRDQDGHAAVMALLRWDARWRASTAYRFMTAVLGVEDLRPCRPA